MVSYILLPCTGKIQVFYPAYQCEIGYVEAFVAQKAVISLACAVNGCHIHRK